MWFNIIAQNGLSTDWFNFFVIGSAEVPAAGADSYFAWGCFRYFGLGRLLAIRHGVDVTGSGDPAQKMRP